MANIVVLTGNLTRDAEIQTLTNGTTICKFTLAVKRPYSKDTTDFLNCVCFNKVAEAIEKYTHKGDKLGVSGYVQKREYEAQDGTKKSVFDIVANDVEFLTTKPKETELVPVDDGDLPF